MSILRFLATRLLAAAAVLGCLNGVLPAQEPSTRPASPPMPEVVAQAFSGKPFGVGKIVLNGPAVAATRPAAATSQPSPAEESYDWQYRDSAFEDVFVLGTKLQEKSGRAVYPALADRRLGSRIYIPTPPDRAADGTFLPQDEGDVWFLFTGEEPLELTLSNVGPQHKTVTLRVKPEANEMLHKELLGQWWSHYRATADFVIGQDYYEPLVETYLTSMLSRRLGLTAPDDRYWSLWGDSTDNVVGLLLGTESIRMAMQKHTILRDTKAQEKADKPMPKPADLPPVEIPAFDGNAEVEPIAMRVPRECFYLRCGSFADFQWLRSVIDERGGDLRNLLATRGVDYEIRSRLERQLALKESVLARIFGDKIIADVAVIGTDTFFREGPAVGILFHAKSGDLLAQQIGRQRRDAMQADKAVSETAVEIGGKKASLLSRPDNAVRSFYVSDGDYHLVTTSRWIAERFLKTGADKEAALGSLKEFRYARSQVPVGRGDAMFLYLSDPFFRNLIGPHYRVEMTRRMQSLAELSVLPVAILAAKAEGAPATGVAELVTGGFLPKGFGARADGSGLALRDGQYTDTLRGGRGSFLPIPDVEVSGLTKSEFNAYERFTEDYRRLWTRMDPVFASLTRQPAGKDRERLTLEFHISPYVKANYGMLEWSLGRPTLRALAPIAGDVAAAQVVLKIEPGNEVEAKTWKLTQHLKESPRVFAGLREFPVPFTIKACQVETGDRAEDAIRGYMGAYRDPDDIFSFFFGSSAGLRPKADAEGYVRKESTVPETQPAGGAASRPAGDSGVWLRFWGEFAVTGQDKSTLKAVTPEIKLIAAEREAQLRLRIGDLGATQFAPLLTAHGYTRARRVSAAGTFLLDTLVQQLHVQPKDALATAEQMLGAKLLCPLGGTYKLSDQQPGRWFSTAWTSPSLREVDTVPAGYHFPGLDWLHGAELEFTLGKDRLGTRLVVELQRQ